MRGRHSQRVGMDLWGCPHDKDLPRLGFPSPPDFPLSFSVVEGAERRDGAEGHKGSSPHLLQLTL